MNILFVHDKPTPGASTYRWRGVKLAAAIQRTSLYSASLLRFDDFFNNTPEAQQQCSSSDMIVLQGRLALSGLGVIQRWKARDKAIVIDLEASDEFPVENGRKRSVWKSDRVPPSGEQVSWALRLADAVTVSSRQMLEEISSYANACLIPDYIDLDLYLNLHPVPHDGIVVGMNCTTVDRQTLDDSGVLSALDRVCQARPQVKVIAWTRPTPENDASPIIMPPEMPLAEIGEWNWPCPLAYVDIGLAPLLTAPDMRLGWSDILEFMAMKIPWLATDGPAYFDLRSHGWLVQNDSGSWERVLLDMVDHLPDYKLEAAGEPYLFGISQGIDENVEHILSVYSSIYRNAFHLEVS